MLAPEHPSPLQSSQVYVLLLALQGSPSFFFQKKNIRPHVTRVRIVRLRINDCPSEPPAWKEVPSCAWSASLLKQRHCKRKRSDTRQDRTHRRSHAAFARFAALDFASTCKNWAVSSDHLPPTSAARTAQRATFSRQLRVSAFHPLTSSRYWKLTSRRCTSFGCAIPSQGTNQSRVDRKLCASKEGRSVRQDFQKACVPHIESGHIEISNRHVRRDASPCFPVRRRTPTRRSVSQARQPLRTTSRRRLHRQVRLDKAMGRRQRRQSKRRNGCASIRHTLPAGKAVKTADANGHVGTCSALCGSLSSPARRKTISLRIALPPAATHVWVDSAHPRRPRQVVRPQSAIPK